MAPSLFVLLGRRGEATQRRPAGAPDSTGRRIAHLPAAIVGNGAILATLSSRGELERLFWPNIDWGQHLGELRLGIAIAGRTRWLDEKPFRHAQEYVHGANIVRTLARTRDLEVEIVDFVDPERSVLVRRVRADASDARLVVYCRPAIDESSRYGGAYRDPSTGALIFYRRGRALALALTPRDQGRVGRIHPHRRSQVLADAADGLLAAESVEYGQVDGALAADLDGEAWCLCAFADAPAAALAELERELEDPARVLDRRLAHDRDRLASASPQTLDLDGSSELYQRSLLAFDLLADRETGGAIAAPEMDADFLHSGGYGFVWGRDMAFILLAFLACDRRDLATRALGWLLRAQSPEGLWLHRHGTDGQLAPSWGLHQIDETGSILFAYETVWRELADTSLDRELWPSARRAADFLLEFRDPADGLPLPSVDLWEEREGVHAHSAAAVAAGLRAAAAMAERHEPALAGRYADAAGSVASAIEQHFWDDELGRYRRSIKVAQERAGGDGRIPNRPLLRYPNRIAAGYDGLDAAVDISLLGLAWPFGIVDPAGPRMTAMARAIENALVLDGGGVLRYEGDVYAGGNPWILATLWLALWYRQVGDHDGFRRCAAYAVRHQNAVGLLPEQVARDGRPAWVVPLTWSHAMFVLAARPELTLVSELAPRPRQPGSP